MIPGVPAHFVDGCHYRYWHTPIESPRGVPSSSVVPVVDSILLLFRSHSQSLLFQRDQNHLLQIDYLRTHFFLSSKNEEPLLCFAQTVYVQVYVKRGGLLYLAPRRAEARDRIEEREKDLGERLAKMQAIASPDIK